VNGRWQPGQSGNPKGRPPGSGEIGQLRAAIAATVPDILATLTELARNGDVQAARLLIERVLPPVRASELGVEIELEGGALADQARQVMAAVGRGDIPPMVAASLISALTDVSRLVEADELRQRVERLEAMAEGRSHG
jgi:hypothetical protein